MELMLFTNDVTLAKAAYRAKIDRLVIDLERKNKSTRQQGYHLEINDHKIEDIKKIKTAVPIKVMCRLNAFNSGTKNEIEEVLNAGADILMLPMFKTPLEVSQFYEIVSKRANTSLLFETKEAISCINHFKDFDVNEIYVGLNDLGIAYKVKFPYELISKGIVDYVREQFPNHDFGFGGITVLDKGFPLPTKDIIKELARLRANQVIIRRAFKRDIVKKNMKKEVKRIKNFYKVCESRNEQHIKNEHLKVIEKINNIYIENI